MNMQEFINWLWFAAASILAVLLLTEFKGCENFDVRDPAEGSHIPPYVNGSKHP